MTAPTPPTLEELIAILSKPFDEGHPDERMGALQSVVLTSLRRLATAEAELAQMRAALEPFAETAEEWDDEPGTETFGDEQAVWLTFRVGDFRRAREAWEGSHDQS